MPRKKANTTKENDKASKRLNLDLPIQTYTRIKELEELTEASSVSEVIRKSLTLYDFVTRSSIEGARLVLKDGDEEREILLLG